MIFRIYEHIVNIASPKLNYIFFSIQLNVVKRIKGPLVKVKGTSNGHALRWLSLLHVKDYISFTKKVMTNRIIVVDKYLDIVVEKKQSIDMGKSIVILLF